jgi:hypothetical protein
MENITAIISFSQSKTYPTDWKVRTEYKNGYKTILVTDEISKNTTFGIKPNKEQMESYAQGKVWELSQGFGIKVETHFK